MPAFDKLDVNVDGTLSPDELMFLGQAMRRNQGGARITPTLLEWHGEWSGGFCSDPFCANACLVSFLKRVLSMDLIGALCGFSLARW